MFHLSDDSVKRLQKQRMFDIYMVQIHHTLQGGEEGGSLCPLQLLQML